MYFIVSPRPSNLYVLNVGCRGYNELEHSEVYILVLRFCFEILTPKVSSCFWRNVQWDMIWYSQIQHITVEFLIDGSILTVRRSRYLNLSNPEWLADTTTILLNDTFILNPDTYILPYPQLSVPQYCNPLLHLDCHTRRAYAKVFQAYARILGCWEYSVLSFCWTTLVLPQHEPNDLRGHPQALGDTHRRVSGGPKFVFDWR